MQRAAAVITIEVHWKFPSGYCDLYALRVVIDNPTPTLAACTSAIVNLINQGISMSGDPDCVGTFVNQPSLGVVRVNGSMDFDLVAPNVINVD